MPESTHQEPHLVGKLFTVVYRIDDPVAWRASNPMNYRHDGAHAVTVSVGDIVEQHEQMRATLEEIRDGHKFQAMELIEKALKADDKATLAACKR